MQEIEQSLHRFVTVARRRNYRAAAIELGMSASALSHAITALEADLGVRLFHRTTRSVALSEAGERLFARVAPALAEIADAISALDRDHAAPRGRLRINASAVAARVVIMPHVLAFLARYPDVEVELEADDRMVDIVADGFDAGVRSADLVPRDMIAVPCSGPIRFAVVASPAYLARHGAPKEPKELAAHACVRHRLAGGRHFAWDFARGRQRVSIQVKGRIVVGNDDLARQAVVAGLGLGYFSEWTIADELARGKVVRVLERWSPSYDRLCVYYASHRHVPAPLRAFIELIRSAPKL